MQTKTCLQQSKQNRCIPFLLLFIFIGTFVQSQAQLSITTANTPVSQNFNSLANTGANNLQSGGIFSTGWSFYKLSSPISTTTYDAGTGSDKTGNIYSFGATGSSDRALGMLQTNNLTCYLGFTFTNNTGSVITSLTVGYTGEEWRSNAADNLFFSYQAGSISLSNTTGWTNVPGLKFTTPVTGSAAQLDGNAAANRTVLTPVFITGLTIANGDTYTLRWVDATGSNSAGMGIDDFTITLNTKPAPPALSPAGDATVDAPFTVTYPVNNSYQNAITGISVNGTALSSAAYSLASGSINFIPSQSALLQSSGVKSIVVTATGYADNTVIQPIAAGAATKLSVKTQPTGPLSNGAVLSTQPVVYIADQYGNVTNNAANITATATQGNWILGGTTTVATLSGTAVFSGLMATSTVFISAATITFSSPSLSSVTSSSFTIPAPPTVYTWNGGNGAWTTAANWTPAGIPGNGDAVIFNTNTAVTVTALPSANLVSFSVAGTNTRVRLQASVATTINITGAAGLKINADDTLTFDGNNAIEMDVNTGSSGTINGTMSFQSGAHSLIGLAAGSINFNAGSTFIEGDLITTGYSGYPFGTSTTAYKTVLFKNGSSYIQYEGGNPFGVPQPNSKVSFEAQSTYYYRHKETVGTQTLMSIAGRTYGNLTIQNQSNVAGSKGSDTTIIQTLTVEAGSSFSANNSNTVTGSFIIYGDIKSDGDGAVTLMAGSNGNIVFSGGGLQTIGGNGTGKISLSRFLVAPGTTVTMQRNILADNAAVVRGILNTDVYIIAGAGTFSLAAGATIATANPSGISISGTIGAVQTTGARTFDAGGNYAYNGTVAQTTGNGLPSSVNNLIILNASGVSLPADITINGTATVNGLLIPSSDVIIGGSGTLQGNGTVHVSRTGSATGDFAEQYYLANKTLANLTVTFTGTEAQKISANTFGNLTITNSKGATMSGNVIVDKSLTLSVASTLTIGGHRLTVNGSIGGSGTVSGSALSDLNLSGSASKMLTFTPGNYYMHNVTIAANANNVSLADSLYITGGNSPGTLICNGTLFTNGLLTLKSDAAGDGRTGISAGQIIGNVTAERFIAGRRAWRFLSVAVVSGQTISEAWQEGAVPNPDIHTRNNPRPGYGTQITYDNNTAHGFDVNRTTAPSLKTWLAASRSWTTSAPFTNTTNINAYGAYCIFIRGSRAVDVSLGTSAPADNTILRATGTLRVGGYTQDYVTTAGNSVLIGNPYASTIDILSVINNNAGAFTADKFRVWDPAIAGKYGVGGYITYTNGIFAPTAPATQVSYSGGTFAQSGQAFMLEATTTGNTPVAFAESDKAAAQANVFGRMAQGQPQKAAYPAVYTNLMAQEDNHLSLIDGVAAGFAGRFSAKVDAGDAGKLLNFNENIMLVRDSQSLAIELRPLPAGNDTLYYKLLYLEARPYVLQIFTGRVRENMPVRGWLTDKYLGTQTEVNLNDTTLYHFTAGSDTASYRSRFMLVFSRSAKAGVIASLSGSAQAGSLLPAAVQVYPNPVRGGRVTLRYGGLAAGSYGVSVYSRAGQPLYQKQITAGKDGAAQSETLRLGSSLPQGSYTLTLTDSSGRVVFSDKLVVAR